MKHIVRSAAGVILVMLTILNGCTSSSKNANATRDSMQDSKEKVSETKHTRRQDAKDAIRQFKQASEERIASYEKSIAAFKTRIKDDKQSSKEEYAKKVSDLEILSGTLKGKLRAFKDDGQDNWEVFKSEFSHNLDGLGKSLTEFFSTE